MGAWLAATSAAPRCPAALSLGDLGESGRAGGWTFRATTTSAGEDGGGGGDCPVLVERMWTPLTDEPAAAATDGQVEVLLDTAAGFSSWLVDRVRMIDPSVPGLGGTVLLRAGITRDVLRPVRLAPDGGRVRVTTVSTGPVRPTVRRPLVARFPGR